jgi:hypothetical protein
MRERFFMKIEVVDFQSFKDAINKFDDLAGLENSQKITIDFSNHDKDIAKRMENFFEVADGGNPEWNV